MEKMNIDPIQAELAFCTTPKSEVSGFSEVVLFELCEHINSVDGCIEIYLNFGELDVSDGSEEAVIVESVVQRRVAISTPKCLAMIFATKSPIARKWEHPDHFFSTGSASTR